MKKFLSDSKMFEFDRHYKECQQNNQPFIKARKNPIGGNYLVLLDLITCNYNLPIESLNKVKNLFTKETVFLQSTYPKKTIFKGCNVNKELVWYNGIVSERLNVFCENLFDIATNDLK